MSFTFPPTTVSGPLPYDQIPRAVSFEYYGHLAATNMVNSYLDSNAKQKLPDRQFYEYGVTPSLTYYMNEDETALIYQYDYVNHLLRLITDRPFQEKYVTSDEANAYYTYRQQVYDVQQEYDQAARAIWKRMTQMGKRHLSYNPMISH
jgi:hypothetical protein